MLQSLILESNLELIDYSLGQGVLDVDFAIATLLFVFLQLVEFLREDSVLKVDLILS